MTSNRTEPTNRLIRRLGIKARLQFFLSVCEAAGPAHQRLVVHLDLEPLNILVGNDGGPTLLHLRIVKLLDASAKV